MVSLQNVSWRFWVGLVFTAPLALPCAAPAQPIPSAQSTLLLTWFDNPSTSMAVQWLTPGDLPPRTRSSAAVAAMPVPRMDRPLTFDGKPEDWGVHGLRVDYLGQPNGHWPDPDSSAATLKLGWTPQGLAVLVTVTDDELTPANTEPRNRRGDRVALRLTGPRGPSGGDAILNVDVSLSQPGQPPVVKVRKQSRDVPTVVPTAAVTRTDTGYVAEVLLPWKALPGFTPKNMARCGFHVELHDVDGSFSPEKLSLLGYAFSKQAQLLAAPLVLVPARRVDAVRARAELRIDPDTNVRRLDIGGEPRLIDETVTVKSGEVTVAKVRLDRVSGFAGAELVLPKPWRDPVSKERLDALTLELDGRTLAYVNAAPANWANPPEPGVATAVKGHTAPPTFPDGEVVPFGRSGWFLHRLRFTGLTPDTLYALAVPGRLDPVRFRTAPQTLDQPLVFAEGGDVGTSHHVGQLHDQAAAWDPLFGLVGGDCAYGNGRDHETWYDYLKLWNDHMTPEDGRSVPMLAAVGNHETNGGWGQTPDASPFFLALFGPLFGGTSTPRGAYGTLDFGQGEDRYASIYLLDSGHTTSHDGQQTKWLKKAMAQRTNVPHQLVCYHVPAYPSHRKFDSPYSAPAREHWVPLFEEHGVDAVFEHHDHTYKRTHLLKDSQAVGPGQGGVLYLGDGCWGRPPRSVDNPLRPYLAVAKSERNVLKVTLKPDGTQDVLAVNEHGKVLDDITIGAGAVTVSE